MAISMEHQALVVPGSIKSSAVGGVEFIVRCCGKHEKSVHIQHPGKHTQEELLRIRDQHLLDVAQEHANHESAIEFLKQAVSSQPTASRDLRQSALSQTDRYVTPEAPKRTENPRQTTPTGDCGCGGA